MEHLQAKLEPNLVPKAHMLPWDQHSLSRCACVRHSNCLDASDDAGYAMRISALHATSFRKSHVANAPCN